MKRAGILLGLSLVAAGVGVAPGMGATQQQPAQKRGDYIVVLKDGKAAAADPVSVVDGMNGVTLGSVYDSAVHGFSAKLTSQAVYALRTDPAVAYVERDGVGHKAGARLAHEAAPKAGQQLPNGVKRVGTTQNKALKVGDGADQRVDVDVAVLDTGIDKDHPDLNVVRSVNCSGVEKCVENSGEDGDGHGSNVAGVIGELDNKTGYTGVAPGARLWSVKTLNDEGSGSSSELVAGLDWVTAHAGEIEVVNISAGYDDSSNAIKDAVGRAVDKGIVVVVSAGNERKDVKNAKYHTPADVPDAITVSAISDGDGKPGGQGEFGWCNKKNRNKDDSLWIDYVNGGGSDFGRGVDIAAPGDCIQSTFKNGEYSNYSGTSQAAPHVAGAAAWLASGAAKPKNRADVMALRAKILKAGNKGWTDNSKDGVQEPLLDLHDPKVFTGTFAK
ncbi:S8 family serine peptidase [Streptomyces sp. NPDC127074]|uniref:S8 family serine peptidase n=1 Tax=Streptomyces sp. NPDC127074 TaxID=3347130 RepID=UPI003667617F